MRKKKSYVTPGVTNDKVEDGRIHGQLRVVKECFITGSNLVNHVCIKVHC